MSAEHCCLACLRRTTLIGALAPRIAVLLERPGRRPAGLLALSEEELLTVVGGAQAGAARARLAAFDERRVRAQLDRAGVACACRHSSAYPSCLLRLPDPPAALHVTGGLERLDVLCGSPLVTVVGGRSASPYGLGVARELGRALAGAGVVVVSGLALGVDAEAHRGAVEVGGRALAVLASGADVPYPRATAALYRRVRGQGAVLSELPLGTPAMRWAFPARNRIMAALGEVCVVVEAAERSGSLITARYAGDLGRVVGAVPGRVTSRSALGSNRLLRDGACVVRGVDDALDELFGAGLDAAGGPRAAAAATAPAAPPAVLEPQVRAVLDAVEAGHGVEAIGSATGFEPGQVRAALGRLELLGLVHRDGLGGYERSAASII